MADAVSGATKAVAMNLFGPHPSITIITFWQGIVEIVLRGVVVILALVVLITASVALNDLNDMDYGDLDTSLNGLDNSTDWDWDQTADLSHGACGFLIFLAIVIMIVEGLIIAQRFLNFGIVDRYIKIFLIADIVISGVFAFIFFCIAISTAVYAARFKDLQDDANDVLRRQFGNDARLTGSPTELNEDMGAVAAFSFFSFIAFVVLAVFMGFSLFLQWRNSQAKYAASGGGIITTD